MFKQTRLKYYTSIKVRVRSYTFKQTVDLFTLTAQVKDTFICIQLNRNSEINHVKNVLFFSGPKRIIALNG